MLGDLNGMLYVIRWRFPSDWALLHWRFYFILGSASSFLGFITDVFFLGSVFDYSLMPVLCALLAMRVSFFKFLMLYIYAWM